MDARKIIEFGKGSYVITIPKEWIDKNKLKKGDILNVTSGLNEVSYSSAQIKARPESIKTVITADDKELNHIEAEIISAYLNNSDSIEVISKNLKTNAPQIKNILRNLSGMEILEQTSTRIVANNLININEISISALIRRMDIITRGMMEDSMKCFEEDHYDSIRSRDWDVNRLFYLAQRVIRMGLKDHRIAQKLSTNPLELHNNHLIVLRLEKTADRQKRIAREMQNCVVEGCKIPEKLKLDIKKIHAEIRDRYLDIMKAYYTKDKKISLKVEITNKDRIERLSKLQDVLHDPKCTRIIENLKATTAEIRNMAKTVMGME